VALFSRLSAWLGSAKAKTRFGDIAEFREFVMDATKRRLDVDSVVADRANPAEFKVTKGERSVITDVTNIFGYLNAYPDEFEEAVRRFVNSIADAMEPSLDESNIVAVVRHRDYLVTAGGGLDILNEPLGADLIIVYMADRPDSMRPVKSTELPGKDLTMIRKIALDNVRRWLPRVVSNDELRASVLYCVEDNPTLSPSLILFDEFWASVAARFPGDVLIALPRKDQLFVFDDDPVARALARRLIAATIEEGFNLLTSNLYARRAGKIVD
jgi:uncharacterized protein YtpQ (UPF0354 family)